MGKSEYTLENFWLSDDSAILLNPRLPGATHQKLISCSREFPLQGCIWMQSSGTESRRNNEHKLVALSKRGMLAAAASVNGAFALTSDDRWLNCLPTFHVGGLSAYARAFLAKGEVFEYMIPWCPENFCDALEKDGITVTSLVPTQIFDLVEDEREAPPELQMIFVGGGAIKPQLYKKARELGWRLLPSYGMTETSAQIATAELASLDTIDFPEMTLLPHVEVNLLANQKLQIHSPAVAVGVLYIGHDSFRWQPLNGKFTTDDRISLHGRKIVIHGRENDLVKILGETVNLRALQETAEEFFRQSGHMAIFVRENERRGFDIFAACEGVVAPDQLHAFNRDIEPFRRIKEFIHVESLPRNSLGKVIPSALLDLIKS